MAASRSAHSAPSLADELTTTIGHQVNEARLLARAGDHTAARHLMNLVALLSDLHEQITAHPSLEPHLSRMGPVIRAFGRMSS